MALVGANAQAPGRLEGPRDSRSNYFLGTDPARWRTDVEQFDGVRFDAVYPGVDVVYYGRQSTLEYDFVVHPGARPEAIALAFSGARTVRLDASGELVLETALGSIRQHAPIVYQEREGRREARTARYVLRGDRTVGFDVDDYDASRVLVIDPVLEYSTYLGGSGVDYAIDVAVDSSGAMYVLGVTPGTLFPAVGYDTTPNGGTDLFVTKFSAAGALVYSTFYGGSGNETSDAFALDSSGNVYVAGDTTGTVPTTAGAYQTSSNGADVFVFKLASTGNTLAYATYLGGTTSAVDHAYAIAVDATGAAYVGGLAAASDFPTTVGAWDRTFGAPYSDGFVTKLNPAGSALVFSTLIGGTGADEVRGIAVHALGTVYVTGQTSACDFPVTAGAADTSCNGSEDAFVTALQSTGAQLAFSTYLGGSITDYGWSVVVDPSGEATVGGYTASANLPAVNSPGGGLDAFVARLAANGSTWQYIRYVGGSGNDAGWAVAVDGAGAAYLAGVTASPNFPTTPGGFNNRPSGGEDGFLTKLNASGYVEYSTYVGTRAADSATALALDPYGAVHLAGWTYTTGLSTAFPVTSSGAYLSGSGDYDAFLMRFNPPIDRLLQIGISDALAIPPVSTVDSTAALGTASAYFGIIEKVSVSVHVTHTWDSDLSLTLIGPDGTSVLLTQGNGGSGDDYGAGCRPEGQRTTFDDGATTPITSGNAPFVGSFHPQQNLAAFSGRQAAGTWRLRATDIILADAGAIQCWTLHIKFRAPIVTGISPAAGSTSGGTAVTITGLNFAAQGDNEPDVRIGGIPVTRTGWSDTTFTGTTNARYSGTADVAVTDALGRTGVLRNGFTYQGLQLLTVTGGGTGNGTVTSQAGLVPAIACTITNGVASGTCAQSYSYSTSVTLTATPTGGSTFSGWSGACGGTGTCPVVMTQARTATASFTAPAAQTLTVTGGGTGNGTVTSQAGLVPAIACTITNGVASGTCAQSYPYNTSVTLTATPTGGSTFSGWSGACGGTGTCPVVMTQARTATASFTAPAAQTLTVTGGGTGNGTVTSQAGLVPAIACTITSGVASGTCAQSYSYNTSVTLTATPTGGSTFSGWSGACSGTGTCPVVMTQARTATATFAPPTLTIETMTPARGSTAGGTLVTMRMAGMGGGGMAVTVGGQVATAIRQIDATTMTFLTPPGNAGPVNVVLTGPSGQASRGFTYEVPVDGSIPGARNARFDYDGRYLVFESDVALVADDTNGVADIYVTDRRAPSAPPVRISVTSQRLQALGGESVTPAISSTGRIIAFASRATNLVPNDSNGAMDIFVHDRDTDGDGIFDEPGAVSTTRVSVGAGGVQADGASTAPALSGSGRWVAFVSTARNLGAGTADAMPDIFVRDRALGTTVALTNGTGASGAPALSLDGRFVAFESASAALVAGDTNGQPDVFLHDRDVDEDGIFDEPAARGTARISVPSGGGGEALGGASGRPSITQDGRWTVFESDATNLVADDTNGVTDVFIHDRLAHTTTRLSRRPDGTQDTAPARTPIISANGSVVHYVRDANAASPAVAADANRVTAAAGSVFGDDIEVPDPTNPTPPAPTAPTTGGPLTAPCVSGNGQAVCGETQPPSPGTPPGTDVGGLPPPPPGPGVAPVIFDWSARRGYWNEPATVDLAGQGFGPTSQVVVDGVAVATDLRGESLRIQLPALPPPALSQPVDRRIEVRNGSLASNVAVFSYDPSPGAGEPPARSNPVVDGLTVTIGPTTGGTPVTVQGHGFAAATVFVDGLGVAPTVATATQLTIPMPAHAAGLVALVVQNGDGVTAGHRPTFEYVLEAAPQPPLVTGVNPNPALAAGNTPLTIAGQHFGTGAAVMVGGVAATSVVVVSDTVIQALAPPKPAGLPLGVSLAVSVTVNGRTGVLPDALSYIQYDPFAASADGDGDGLPGNWEGAYGLSDTDPTDAGLDSDGDGRTNTQEFADGTHPRSLYTRYFAEGSTGPFFTTRISIANPNASPATVLLRVLTDRGASLPKYVVVAPRATKSIVVDTEVPGASDVAFASVIESDVEVVVDRSMFWGTELGSSAETSVPAPALQWYLAEGATHGNFSLFYLLQNPSLTTAAQVRIRYLKPTGAPVERLYSVAPRSRLTIEVDSVPGLEATDVSGVIESQNNVPIIVERAMYSVDPANPGLGWIAGHESAGVTAPSTHWFLAEGATGSFFDLFVLFANPNPQPADLRVTYLLENGSNVVKTYTVPGNARRTVYVAAEDPQLAATSVATTVESTNDVPIVVERAMWWPHAQTWQEAHNSAGSTVTGVTWGLAEGEINPANQTTTYILVANTSSTAATVRITLLFPSRDPVSRDIVVLPNSRKTVDVGTVFGESAHTTFGAVIESLTGEQIVVERAMYSNAPGILFATGSNALGTKLR